VPHYEQHDAVLVLGLSEHKQGALAAAQHAKRTALYDAAFYCRFILGWTSVCTAFENGLGS
jgi:hypothetical protein